MLVLIPENKIRNQDMLYGVNVIMRHLERAIFLNTAPETFKQFWGKTIFHCFMKNIKKKKKKNSKFLRGFILMFLGTRLCLKVSILKAL